MSRFLLSVTAAAFAACSQPAPQQAAAPPAPPDSATVRAALTAASASLNAAYLAGDAATVASLFTADARAEYAGFPSGVGRAGIQSLYEDYYKTTKLSVSETLINAVNSLTPDLATAGGTYHSFGSGKPAHAWWRWAAAYRKEADGQYRISYIIAFPDSTK